MSLRDDTIAGTLAQALAPLPRPGDTVFRSLWDHGRLRYADECRDVYDEWSARLVAGALWRRRRVLVVLPDAAFRRPALLFATCLVQHAYDGLAQGRSGGHVLYFGSTIGVRDQLGRTSVGDLNLASVFPQTATRRGAPRPLAGRARSVTGRQLQAAITNRLPRVTCIYSPADPLAVVAQFLDADWYAIDCDCDADLPWLGPLLAHAASRDIPVVAWGHNHLSGIVEAFAAAGSVLRWPLAPVAAADPLDWFAWGPTVVAPVVLTGPGAEAVGDALRDAHRSLARLAGATTGRLQRDALRVAWRLLRALEDLAVPFEFYEAEARRTWGIQPISHLQDALYHFIDAVEANAPSLAAALRQVAARAAEVAECLRGQPPPLWAALQDLCTGVPEGEWRALVFPGPTRKRPFGFDLLARRNLSEEDLHRQRVLLVTANEYRPGAARQDGTFAQVPAEARIEPVLVGLPSPWFARRLDGFLRLPRLRVLIYPYQLGALARRATAWDEATRAAPDEILALAAALSGTQPGPCLAPLPPRVVLDATTAVSVAGSPAPAGGQRPELMGPLDRLDEMARLLDAMEDEQEELLPQGLADDVRPEEFEEAWVDAAVEVRFAEGWHVLLAPSDTVNVIWGHQVEEHYVRGLRPTDRVLFIHGQARQNLYDLILSRVHRHPAIELHVALIRRWQQELAEAYRRCRERDGLDLDDVLQQLRQRGSLLYTTQTLRGWLRGMTLCPLDERNLRRLAEILEMPFVAQHHVRIHRAAQRLRGLHSGLANRLNRWLEHGAGAIVSGELLDPFDPELGLTLADFRHALLVLTVSQVSQQPGPFLRQGLGRLEREENP